MARRKRHGGRRNALSKLGRKGLSLLGSASIIAGGAYGAATAVQRTMGSGNWARLPQEIVFSYTGYNADNGQLVQQQLITNSTVLIGGVVVGKLLKWASRMV